MTSDGALIDLRSDTVTKPSDGMRRAIAEAEVGDDVLDGDPTTRRLEARVAELLGHESALFFPSGTQANQVAIGLIARPGTEIVVEAAAHLLHFEQHGAAVIWGVQLVPVPSPDGLLTAELAREALRPKSPDLPNTAAIAVENSHNAAGGRVMSCAMMEAVRAVADSAGVPLYIDGARLWNAAAHLGVEVSRLARLGALVMVSFSKGLGCPVGSCLAGPKALLEQGVVARRRLGGGMRQSGVLAAAGLYALDHHLSRIAEDHETAQLLADELADHPEVSVVAPETNIVMLDLKRHSAAEALGALKAAGVLLSQFGPSRLRAVTHLGVTSKDVKWAAARIAKALA
jgi:threonine aldolase